MISHSRKLRLAGALTAPLLFIVSGPLVASPMHAAKAPDYVFAGDVPLQDDMWQLPTEQGMNDPVAITSVDTALDLRVTGMPVNWEKVDALADKSVFVRAAQPGNRVSNAPAPKDLSVAWFTIHTLTALIISVVALMLVVAWITLRRMPRGLLTGHLAGKPTLFSRIARFTPTH